MTFHVGQKVARFKDGHINVSPKPAIGETVTILWLGEWRGQTIIDLVEYPTTETATLTRGYNAAVFRPVVELKTDAGMAILKRVAANASKKREVAVDG